MIAGWERIRTGDQWKMDLAGEWRLSHGEDFFPVRDPSTGEVIARCPAATPEDVRAAVDSAREAFERGPWPRTSPRDRARILRQVGDRITDLSEAFVNLEVRNGGKTIRQATFFDVALASEHLRYFADLAERIRRERIDQPDLPGTTGYLLREPVGVCATIVPWNLPLLMAVWKVGPALAAGNTVILKPSSLTPLSALALASLFEEAGLPPGTLQVVTGTGPRVGSLLASHPGVDLVSFTGSTEVGRDILARGAPTVKRTLLELGGKSAAILLPDADLEAATDGAVFGIFLHAGQLCESTSRLLVPRKQADEVVRRLLEKIRRIRIGPPDSFETDMGPLISEGQRDRVEGYVKAGVDAGATLLAGGQRPDRPELRRGYYFRPTLFRGVTPDMRIAQEEIFGPVLSLMEYEDVDQAVEWANGTIYGLAASVWSSSRTRAMKVAEQLRAGTVWINDQHILTVHAPRGGFKQSGIGRELGPEALDEYTELKHVFVDETRQWSQIAYPLVLPPPPPAPGSSGG